MGKVQKRGRRVDGFTRSIDDEVRYGIVYADYRNKLSVYLLPRDGDTAEQAEQAIRQCRFDEAHVPDDAPPGREPNVPENRWTGIEP